MRLPPFLPFQEGSPRFNVGLKPIDRQTWLLPDSEASILPWRRDQIEQYLSSCYRSAETHRDAESEACSLVLSALGKTSQNGLILTDVAGLISDDLVVLNQIHDHWTVTSLVLNSPTFFSVDHAYMGDLTILHGPVPDGTRLAGRIARVFDHLPDGQILERFNWTLQAGADRDTPDGSPLRERASKIEPHDAHNHLHLRVERQTIRRLPETGGILFTIRVAIDPVSAIPVDAREGLAAAWRGISEDGARYKKWIVLEPLTQALFDSWNV